MPYKDPEKQKEAKRKSYENNKEKVKASANSSRDKRNAAIIAIKEASPCMDCGVFYPHYVMDFDHRDPSTKLGSVANLLDRASMSAILEEISKCDLVCANCHRERTWGPK